MESIKYFNTLEIRADFFRTKFISSLYINDVNNDSNESSYHFSFLA